MSSPERVLIFDDPDCGHFYPLSSTRPFAHLRVGACTLLEVWQRVLGLPCTAHAPQGLVGTFRQKPASGDWLLNARLLPSPELISAVLALQPGEALLSQQTLIAARCLHSFDPEKQPRAQDFTASKTFNEPVKWFERLWDLLRHQNQFLNSDIAVYLDGREGLSLHPSNSVLGDQGFFLNSGANVAASVLDCREGPIYVGKHSEIMPGALIRGPVAIGDHCVVKMGAKLYGPLSLGPGCKVGGELSHSILLGHSNKGHDGFLGHSVLGEWCNLGADTNTSNLKNDYGKVKLFNRPSAALEDSQQTFLGLFMGDHSKAGINTMFNTGTVVGVCSNVFGGDFPPKHIPSFSWGGAESLVEHRFDKALETAERVMARREMSLSLEQKAVLKEHFELSSGERNMEKTIR